MTLETTVLGLNKAQALSGLLSDHERDWLHDARAAHELLAQLDGIRDAWKEISGFAVCESNGPEGRYRITIDYPTLEKAQDAYGAMAEITKTLEESK